MPLIRAIAAKWGARIVWSAVLVSSTMASYTLVSAWRQERRAQAIAARRAAAAADSLKPRENPFAQDNGRHLIAYVITASDCGWSGLPEASQAIRSLRAKLQAKYADRYARIRVVAVVIDDSLQVGLEHLEDLGKGVRPGAFDQAIVGGSWLNEQVVRFVWKDRVADAASPQIVVIERPVNTEAYLDAGQISVDKDLVVANPSGLNGILSWVHQGLPLDAFMPQTARDTVRSKATDLSRLGSVR